MGKRVALFVCPHNKLFMSHESQRARQINKDILDILLFFPIFGTHALPLILRDLGHGGLGFAIALMCVPITGITFVIYAKRAGLGWYRSFGYLWLCLPVFGPILPIVGWVKIRKQIKVIQ